MTARNLASLFICLTFIVTNGEVSAGESEFIEPSDGALKAGRTLWLENCMNCHAYGTADAPIPMRPEEWRDRVTKAKDVLYTHAIEGFIGPDYSMMPARGGNEDLSDSEVKAAVDYMVFLARYYIDKNE